MKLLLFKSESYNPYENLAVEELLMDVAAQNKDSILLYLWQNEPSVILGRNQNPYIECNLSLMQKNGVHLVRRESGGGTVYHDLGNLNYTVIAHDLLADKAKWTNILCGTVKGQGLMPQISGRNDLTIEGKKFSGTAYTERDHIVMQHGTIMVDVELEYIEKYLHANISKLQKRGIRSIGERVCNLSDFNSSITIEEISHGLIRQFTDTYEGYELLYCYISDWLHKDKIAALKNKYESAEFLYGNLKTADIMLDVVCSWAVFRLEMALNEDIIDYCNIYTDALDIELIKRLKAFIRGKELKGLKDKYTWNQFECLEGEDEKVKEFSKEFIGKLV